MEFFVIGLLVLFAVFCIMMIVSLSKANKKVKLKSASLFIALPHTAGLPIPERTLCQLYSYPDRIEINANGTQFTLMKVKSPTFQ